MDAADALADLTEICSQIEAAVVVDAAGAVLAASGEDAAADRLARAGAELLEAAESDVPRDGAAIARLEAALRGASIFVARERGHTIVARTSPNPASGLVFYDLGTCLGQVSEPAKKPRRRAPRRKVTTDA